MLGIIEASLEDYQTNVGINVGINDQVLDLIRQDGRTTAARMAEQLAVSVRQVERAIKFWRDLGVLTRDGSNKSGHWVVSDEPSQSRRR